MVVNTVFAGGKKTELTIKVQDIPGIDQRPAFDGPADQFHHVSGRGNGLGQVTFFSGPLTFDQQAIDLRPYASSHRRNHLGLS